MKLPKFISFSSGKGGVGKTTVVGNLGHLWAQAGKNTLLVDGDWSLGKLGISMGVRPHWTIDQVLDGQISMQEAVLPVRQGLSLLGAPSGRVGFEEVGATQRQQIFYGLEALADGYDRILVDHASGVHDAVLQFAAAAHQHVILTTIDPTSYTDAYAIMKLLSKRFAIRQFLLLVTFSEKQAETEATLVKYLDVVRGHLDVKVSVLEVLPWEPKVRESLRSQEPMVLRYPENVLTQKLKKVVQHLDQIEMGAAHGLQFCISNRYQPLRNL